MDDNKEKIGKMIPYWCAAENASAGVTVLSSSLVSKRNADIIAEAQHCSIVELNKRVELIVSSTIGKDLKIIVWDASNLTRDYKVLLREYGIWNDEFDRNDGNEFLLIANQGKFTIGLDVFGNYVITYNFHTQLGPENLSRHMFFMSIFDAAMNVQHKDEDASSAVDAAACYLYLPAATMLGYGEFIRNMCRDTSIAMKPVISFGERMAGSFYHVQCLKENGDAIKTIIGIVTSLNEIENNLCNLVRKKYSCNLYERLDAYYHELQNCRSIDYETSVNYLACMMFGTSLGYANQKIFQLMLRAVGCISDNTLHMNNNVEYENIPAIRAEVMRTMFRADDKRKK